jgi:O-antigen ligase
VLVAAAAAAAAWPVVGDRAIERVRQARDEMRAALVDGEYATSTGLRIALWGWAWEIFREHPLAGAGAGSFRLAQAERPAFRRAAGRSPQSADYLARDDAHSTPLHVLATTGIPGGLALLAVLALAIRGAARDVDRHAYATATPLVVAGWIIVGFFGCAHLSGQQLAILALAVTAAIPRAAAPPSAPTARETTPP